jgi:hypothetical protein
MLEAIVAETALITASTRGAVPQSNSRHPSMLGWLSTILHYSACQEGEIELEVSIGVHVMTAGD